MARSLRAAAPALVALLLAALVAGCPAPVDDDDDSAADCAAATGTLRVCVCWDEVDEEPAAEALVAVRTELEDPFPVEALVGPDGCVEVDVAPGAWEWSARNSTMNCVSPFEPAVVAACRTEERKVYLMPWCVVGG